MMVSMRTQKAWTLLEMVIVLVVVGILGYLTLKTPDATFDLNAEASQLASDIRYVQYTAMTQQNAWRINFSTNSYNLTSGNGVTPLLQAATQSATVNLPPGMSLNTTQLPQGYLLFDGYGIPRKDENGNALMMPATVMLNFNGQVATVTIQAETGQVSF